MATRPSLLRLPLISDRRGSPRKSILGTRLDAGTFAPLSLGQVSKGCRSCRSRPGLRLYRIMEGGEGILRNVEKCAGGILPPTLFRAGRDVNPSGRAGCLGLARGPGTRVPDHTLPSTHAAAPTPPLPMRQIQHELQDEMDGGSREVRSPSAADAPSLPSSRS